MQIPDILISFNIPSSHNPAMSSQVRVAVTQAEPVWLDLDATVKKTCDLIVEAAANGAQLVAFPECWIPGYPAWIWWVHELHRVERI